MLSFICYFFPAVISLRLFEALSKSSLSLKKCIYRFCCNTLLINFLCLAVKKTVFHTANNPMLLDSSDMLPIVALNYMIIAVPFAAVIALAEVLLSKRIKITVEEKADEAEKE